MPEILKVKEYGIASRIEKESLPESHQLEKFVTKVNQYIDFMEIEAVEHHMKSRDESHITYYQTLDFFRNNERLQNTKYILQYLIKFLEGLPSEEKSAGIFQNPFLQFRDFVIFLAEQLRDVDVIESVLREYKELKLLNEKTEWYYRGVIRGAFKEISTLCINAKHAVPHDYSKLFSALQKHSLFWFSVRRENEARIRKSDIYIYRLCRILLSRMG